MTNEQLAPALIHTAGGEATGSLRGSDAPTAEGLWRPALMAALLKLVHAEQVQPGDWLRVTGEGHVERITDDLWRDHMRAEVAVYRPAGRPDAPTRPEPNTTEIREGGPVRRGDNGR